MSIKKDEAIHGVMTDFEGLANLVLSQLDNLEDLINSGVISVPETVEKQILATEKNINKLEVKLSEKVVNTIVLFQPVASEIRKLFALYRIIISLERISDHVVKITEIMRKIKNQEIYSNLSETIYSIVLLSSKMVKNSLVSFSENDMDLAVWTIKTDPVISEFSQKLLKKAISNSKNSDDKKNILLSFIFIKEMVSNIERIADHSTNIAEASIYAFEGKDIRHYKLSDVEVDKKTF